MLLCIWQVMLVKHVVSHFSEYFLCTQFSALGVVGEREGRKMSTMPLLFIVLYFLKECGLKDFVP